VSPERERSGFAALSWRIHLAVVGALVALSAIAWVRTVNDARSMSGMVMGLGQVGSLAAGSMGAGIFLAMWAVMMAAMMLPTVAPMVLAHIAIARRRGGGYFPTIVFVVGYLAVWFASGVPPYFAYVWLSRLAAEAAQSRWLPVLAGSILVFAGTYQFTGWKQLCLDKCQSPFAFILTHDFDGGVRSALRAGVWHGVFCLGCCWALMIVLLVVGVMNLAWMIGLFLVFLVEKSWRHGLLLARVAGAALVVLGVMVIVDPTLLPRIS
jgi:predicted metal-binding membrane protein